MTDLLTWTPSGDTIVPDLDSEQWRPVSGYEGLYEVSNHGRVRSLWFKNGKVDMARVEPLVLAQHINNLGYASLTLVRGGKHVTHHVHRLVCAAFRGPAPEGFVCGHRDGAPSHNHISNLEWISFVENEADKRRHGRNLPGSKNHQAKLTEEKVREMRALQAERPMRYRDLAKLYGISAPVAHKIVTRRSWKHVP